MAEAVTEFKSKHENKNISKQKDSATQRNGKATKKYKILFCRNTFFLQDFSFLRIKIKKDRRENTKKNIIKK